jgi:type I restriction enzyme, S subunit
VNRRAETRTGGRDATTRHIFGEFALSVGMPNVTPPTGWRWVALTDIARLESGHTPSRQHSEYWGGDIPWIGIRDAKAHHGQTITKTIQTTNELGIRNSSARILPEGTVCLSRTASVGYVITMGRPMATSQDFANWICSDKIDHRFLVYLFLAEQDSLLRFASGAIHQTIYYPELKALHVCIPSPREQRSIVASLDEAFTGLATATANAEKNLKNSRELFDSYLNSVFTRKGEGWTTATIGEAVESGLINAPQDGNHGEIHPKASDYVDHGVPFVMASDLEGGDVDCDDCKFISEKTAGGLRKGFAKDGDVLLSHKGTIGRVAILTTDREFVVLTPQVTYYRVKNTNLLLNRFIRFIFESAAFQSEMARIAGAGSTRAYIGITKQLELTISYPPLTEQHSLVRALDALQKDANRLEFVYRQKLNLLTQLRQSILQRAFSGELTSPPFSAIKEAAE